MRSMRLGIANFCPRRSCARMQSDVGRAVVQELELTQTPSRGVIALQQEFSSRLKKCKGKRTSCT